MSHTGKHGALRWSVVFSVLLGSYLGGCYPNREISSVQVDALPADTLIKAATKAYLRDASVVLFPEGFSVHRDTVVGISQRFYLSRTDNVLQSRRIALNSIVAMSCYNADMPAGRVIASFVLGVYGIPITPLSIYCLACPKCCFGSCPTVYTSHQGKLSLAAELFSRSIAKTLEGNDLRLLETCANGGQDYKLRVTNEALETHYINSFSVIAVSHSPGTTVLPRAGGGLSCFSHPISPSTAFNRAGQNVIDLVKSPDGNSYRSGTESFRKVKDGELRDWVEMNVRVPKGSRSATMVVRKRNTLLSTVLLYDVVLGSQGMRALEWTEKMNTDQEYAGRFKSVYEAFSGITVQTLSKHKWTWQSFIPDTGPIAWNFIAVEIPLSSSRDLTVRLEFFPDNFMIDYVGFAFSHEVDTTVVELSPTRILDNHGVERPEVAKLIEQDDDQYLVTNPGESYRLQYQLPLPDGRARTLFVRSRGYYNEWIRGEWLTMDRAGYRFNLDDVPGTLSQLVQSWLRDRETVERAFWEAKIPVKEDP